MGTFFEVDLRVPAARGADVEQWLRFVRKETRRLEKIYSRHDPASELSRLNRSLADPAAPTRPSMLSPELANLIAAAERFRLETRGAFDISLGPLVELWTAAAASGELPSASGLETALLQVGSGHHALASKGFPASTGPPGRLDLDAISKGAVLDRLAESFVEHFPHGAALLSFGQSSIWGIGDPAVEPAASSDRDCLRPDRGWLLTIRSRDPARGRLGALRLCDRSLSMSSSLGSVLEVAGKRWSHVIDPRSGWPVEGSYESIVIADSAARADAWSTALLVRGRIPDDVEEGKTADLEMWLMDDAGRPFETDDWPGISD